MSLASRLVRNRISLVGLAVFLLLAGFVAFNLLHTRMDPRLDAIRKAGYPATLAELDRWYTSVPDAENAALIYTNAFSFLTNSVETVDHSFTWADITYPRRGQRMLAEDSKNLHTLITSNLPAIKLMVSADKLRRSRYPIALTNGFTTPLPYLAKVKQAVTVLADDALLQAEAGDHREAKARLGTALHLCNSLNEEPLLISQLVRFAGVDIIFRRLEWMQSTAPLTADELRELETAFREAGSTNASALALAGERCLSLAVFDDPKFRRSMFSQGGLSGISTAPSPTSQATAGAVMFAYRASGLFAKDRSYFLDAMGTNIACAELDYPARFIQSQKAAAAFIAPPNRMYIISRMLLPALGKFQSREAEHTTRIRVVLAALATERYRLEHGGQSPASLNDLVPNYLAAVPSDPCDGKPLRYKASTNGFLVYGIGADGADDGGLERKPKASGNYDITFTVER